MIKLSSIKSSYSNYILITLLSGVSFIQIISVDYFFSVNESVKILEFIAIGNILSRLSINILCFEEELNDYVRVDVFNLTFLGALSLIAYLLDPLCMYLFIFFLFREILKLSSKRRKRVSYFYLLVVFFIIGYLSIIDQKYYLLLFVLPIVISLSLFSISYKVNYSFNDLLSFKNFVKKFRTIYSDAAVHINSYLINVFPSSVFSGTDFIIFRKLLAIASVSSLLNSFSIFYFKKSTLKKVSSYLFLTIITLFICNLFLNDEIYITFLLFFFITSFSTIFYSFARAKFQRDSFFLISLISPVFVSIFFFINLQILLFQVELIYFFNLLILCDLLVIYFINKKLNPQINNNAPKNLPKKWVFFAGPPKSGTSYLYELFKKNGFSNNVGYIKEPDYWYNNVFPNNILFNNIKFENKANNIGSYSENYHSERLMIDCSPSTALDIEIMKEIYKANPDSYLVFIERNSKDRALSQYRQFKDTGFETESFDHAVRLISKRIASNWHLSYNYNFTLNNIVIESMKIFGNDKVLLIQFDDLISKPKSIFKEICQFINEQAPEHINLSNLSKNQRKLPRNKFVKLLIYLSFRLKVYNIIVSILAKTRTLNYMRVLFFK